MEDVVLEATFQLVSTAAIRSSQIKSAAESRKCLKRFSGPS